jgi:hypothetical protein
MRGFESLTPDCVRCTKAVRPVVVRDLAGSTPVVHPAQVTQRIECQVPNLVAGGSIPPLGTASEYAPMAELEDAPGSDPGVREDVGVRSPLGVRESWVKLFKNFTPVPAQAGIVTPW